MRRCRFVLILVVVGAGSLGAQQRKRNCTGDAPDSTLLARGPVYRDCDVDKPAEISVEPRTLGWSPPTGESLNNRCFRAEVQFVVDTIGVPEFATLRRRGDNSRDLADAVDQAVSGMRYTPARLDGKPVRQLVIYKRTVMTRTVVSSTPISPGRPAQDRMPPKC